MKPLYWTRIIAPKNDQSEASVDCVDGNDSAEQTDQLWKEIDETKLDNMDEFAELFSRQTIVPKKKNKENAAPKPKQKFVKVLDCKRSQCVGIFARSLHCNFEIIERAIYHWDTTIVSLETLQRLLELGARSDELQLIRDAIANQNDVPLDEPEQFLLKLANVSCSTERISCIIFIAEFSEACEFISRKIDTMCCLCEFLTHNKYLKDFFSIILTCGNFMNGGNRVRGQADGFELDILNKLRDVKSNDPRITLLHYIIRCYISKQRKAGLPLQKIVYPIPDDSDVNRALSMDFIEVSEQINELKRKLSGKNDECEQLNENESFESNKITFRFRTKDEKCIGFVAS